jgi:hypothetical protein
MDGVVGGGWRRTVIKSTTGFEGETCLEGPDDTAPFEAAFELDATALVSESSRADLDDFSQLSKSPTRFLFFTGGFAELFP